NVAGPSYPKMGKIEVYEEDTGNLVNAGFTNIEGWASVTFSGTGTNDTRCFAVRPFNNAGYNSNGLYYVPPFDSYSVREFDYRGEVPQEIRPLQGASVLVGNIRYSPFHNHLFVSYNR